MAIPVLTAMLESSSPRARGTVLILVAATGCLAFLAVLGASLYLAVRGTTVPPWIPAILSVVLGGGVFGAGSQTTAAHVSRARTTSAVSVAADIAANGGPH